MTKRLRFTTLISIKHCRLCYILHTEMTRIIARETTKANNKRRSQFRQWTCHRQYFLHPHMYVPNPLFAIDPLQSFWAMVQRALGTENFVNIKMPTTYELTDALVTTALASWKCIGILKPKKWELPRPLLIEGPVYTNASTAKMGRDRKSVV